MTALMRQIEQEVPRIFGWCPVAKATTLAALVVALRPAVIVEIGVCHGRSLYSLALACKELKHGTCYAIDPWDAAASVVGQTPEHAQHWGGFDHEAAYTAFLALVEQAGVAQGVRILRQRSNDVDLTQFKEGIQLFHCDGNHSASQAVRDVERFTPLIPVGGICVLDDLDWSGPPEAEKFILENGFLKLYALGTGACYLRQR